MQTMIPRTMLDVADPKARKDAELRELFQADSERELVEKMDKRREELEAQGYVLKERRKIGRNEPCPCGSGVKFKRCCMSTAPIR